MKTRRRPCRNCVRLADRVAAREKQLAAALARVEQLEKELVSARKNSSTSSKPPSSDIVKPPRPAAAGGKRRKRRRGGPPGHEKHTRPLFPPEQVDHAWVYEWPEPGADWEPLDEFRTVQQVDLVEKLFEVTEHRARLYRSQTTGEVIAVPLPQEVRLAGLVGPRLTALLAFQKGACHMSYTSIRTFLGDVLGLELSTGQIAKIIQKASAALGPSHAELEAALPWQSVMNIDETGHPENGKKLWTWGFHVPGSRGFTWFHIDPSRSAEVLRRAKRAPQRSEAQNIAERFRDHGAHYFTFLNVPGVEPTNNAMEQRMRFVAIDRKITQGTRGQRGRRWCERMWTVLATCVQQGRSAFQFLHQSILAYFRGHAGPSRLALPP
jgi:hypothetical protein